MRWLVWLCVVGCSFEPNTAGDDPPLTDDARPVDTGSSVDADEPGIDASPVDAATGFACATASLTCATGAAVFADCNGKCWIACRESVAQPEAKQRCAAWGGRLAPLQTTADHVCFHTVVLTNQAAWTGFEQAAGQSTDEVGWTWNGDGQPVAFTNWSGGQPNDGPDSGENGQEQCAYKSNPSGTWQDTSCAGDAYAFACREP